MQELLKNGFQKDSMLMGSALAGSILWMINGVFNLIAKDYRAFGISILYVICLITLCGAEFKQEKNVIQGMIGGLLMVSLVGSVNVLTEMLSASIPSRALWQLILGTVLMVALFVNHFLISHSRYHTNWRICINQLIVVALLILRCYQIILNVARGGLSFLIIEVTLSSSIVEGTETFIVMS